jgi:hypothetical protein
MHAFMAGKQNVMIQTQGNQEKCMHFSPHAPDLLYFRHSNEHMECDASRVLTNALEKLL